MDNIEKMTDGAKFEGMEIEDRDFSENIFNKVIFSHCVLSGVDFSRSMGDITFNHCEFKQVTAYGLNQLATVRINHSQGDIYFNGSNLKLLSIQDHKQGHLYLGEIKALNLDISGDEIIIGCAKSVLGTVAISAKKLIRANFMDCIIKSLRIHAQNDDYALDLTNAQIDDLVINGHIVDKKPTE